MAYPIYDPADRITKNFLAGLEIGKRIGDIGRDRQYRNILAQSYKPGEAVPFETTEEQQFGLPPLAGNVASVGAGGIDMPTATRSLFEAGFGPEAMKLEETQSSKALQSMLTQATIAEKLRRKAPTSRQVPFGEGMVRTEEYDPSTGEWRKIAEGKRTTPDWMMPGFVEAKRKEAEAKGEGRMSPTAQKELFEADETAQASSNVIGLLKEGLKINEKAYYGPGAKIRAQARSLLPGGENADATISLDNLMTGQALESLKATFGGMPTEGERKILLEMQASVDKTPGQRKDILDRAIKIAERRQQFNRDKAKSIREGKYLKESPAMTPLELNAPSAAPTNNAWKVIR